MDKETRRVLLNKACNEYRNGKSCVKRNDKVQMVRVRGREMHPACAEIERILNGR